MSREDVKRYIELEVPDIGLVENDVSEVVCFRGECDNRVRVDSATLVVEDNDAVDLVAEVGVADPNEPADRKRVEIYCSPGCRDKRYFEPTADQDDD